MILIVTRRFAPAPRIKTRRFGPDKRLSAIAKSVPATSLPILAVIGPQGPKGDDGEGASEVFVRAIATEEVLKDRYDPVLIINAMLHPGL